MALYGQVQGKFLAQDGQATPLTGHIIFTPHATGHEAGVDYLPTPIIGQLNEAGELTDSGGEPLLLMYGTWHAMFQLRFNGRYVPIPPVVFDLAGDVWITQMPGGGWSFEIIPNGDGTARLIAENITVNDNGTATVRMA